MLKKILTYAIGTVFCRMISYILLPLYTNHLTVAEYGEVSLSLTTTTMLLSFVFMEIWCAFLRFGFDDPENGFDKLYTNTFATISLILPVFCLVTLLIAKWQHLPYIGLMIGFGVTQLFFYVEQFLCRIKKMPLCYVYSGVISSAMQLIFAFCLVRFNRLTPQSMLYIPILSSVVATGYIMFKTRKYQHFVISLLSRSFMKEIVVFSFPLSLNSVAYWAMTNIGVYIARSHLGAEANGYVAVASKFTAIIMLVVSVYNLAWQETAFEFCNNSRRGIIYTEQFRLFSDSLCYFTVIVIILMNIIFPYYIGNNAYYTAQLLLPIYFAGTYINALSSFLGILYSVEKKNHILLYTSIAGCVCSIAIVYALIGILGVFSVPVGFCFGMAVNTVLRYLLIKKYANFNIELKATGINIILVTVFVLLAMSQFSLYIELMAWSGVTMYFMRKWKQELIQLARKIIKIPLVKRLILVCKKIANAITPKNSNYVYVIPHPNCRTDWYDPVNANSDNVLVILNKIFNDSKSFSHFSFFVEYYDAQRYIALKKFVENRMNDCVDIKLIKASRLVGETAPSIYRKIRNMLLRYRCATWLTDTWLMMELDDKCSNQKWIALSYCVPLKKAAYPDAVFTDLLVETSPVTAKVHAEGYGLDIRQMPILGFPRNDNLFHSDKEVAVINWIHSKINFEYKHLIVYAPTYRDYEGAYSAGCIFGYEYDPERLEKFLEDHQILIIAKMHPLQEVGGSIYTKHVLEYEKSYDFSLYDVLAISDMLISDYSSVIHDYILTGKKVVHNFFDKERYNDTRGFAFNPVEDVCPGSIATTMDELIGLIKNELSNYVVSDKYKNVVKMFHSYPDGSSTERVMNFLEKEICG